MGLNRSIEAAMTGKGTKKSTGAALGDTALAALVFDDASKMPSDATGADIFVNSGTIFVTNDGTPASAASFPFETGSVWKIRESNDLLLNKIHLFANAPYDIRVMWWK